MSEKCIEKLTNTKEYPYLCIYIIMSVIYTELLNKAAM